MIAQIGFGGLEVRKLSLACHEGFDIFSHFAIGRITKVPSLYAKVVVHSLRFEPKGI